MLAVPDRPGAAADQAGQCFLPVEQRAPPEIEAVEMQQVEGIEYESVAAAFGEIAFERAEVGEAVFRGHDHFAIQHKLIGVQIPNRLNQYAELLGPVVPAA